MTTAGLPSIQKIAELLGGEVSGGQVLCPGPAHGVGDRSLSVKPDRDDREGFVTHSFAGDDWKDCRAHVRAKLGLPEPKPESQKKTNGSKAAWSVLGEYIYYDQNGERFLRVRKCRDETGKKQFPQYHWDGNGWAKGKPDGPKIPYRLPQLIATPTTAQVYFCEGEKDADNLARIGFVATTASEGAAAKWDSGLTLFFKDRRVVILPDADRPGRGHAQKVAKAIHGVAASVKIVDLYPDRYDGSDVSDWIASDTAGVRLAKEVKEAPLWGPSDPATSAGTAADGAELLADVHRFCGRFVAYPSDNAHVAHTLWIAHAHAMEAWDSTPRIAFLSPEPGSGKTRALEVSEILVSNPVEAINVTPAYLFRKVGAEEGPPTILYDEIDTVFGPKAKDNEEIRGLLNAGHRRGAVAGRCVVRGKIVETEEIPAYCAVALAGLGWLPDTLMSRSIVVRMRRRAPSEIIEPYRRRDEIDEGHALRGRLAGWAAAKAKILYAARPAMPPGIEDRNADVWEALFAVADAAGGDWPKKAREAAVALIAAGREEEPSLGIRLLADLRTVFAGEKAKATLFTGKETPVEALFTETILGALHSLEEAPWKDLRDGKGRDSKSLDSRGLALRLRQYGIKSKQIREGTTSKKGYQRADLADAWARYLPSSQTSETSETAETTQHFQGPNVSDVSDSPSAVSDEAPDVSDSPQTLRSMVRTFAEPCCGDGALVRHLESFGLRCAYAGEIATGQDALAIDHYDADAIITNPPYKRPAVRNLVRHFTGLSTPAWLLLRLGVASTVWAAPLLRHSDIVVVPRLKLIADTKHSGMEDHACCRFDSRHSCGPVFHNNRGQGEAIPRRTRVCEQCGKSYEPQRSKQGSVGAPGVRCLLLPTADVPSHTSRAAMCHVWTAPGWQELSSRTQAWVGAAMCSAF